ncbi:MAG: 50S ribosomal protein L4, partial [Pseudomonadota bacterium]
ESGKSTGSVDLDEAIFGLEPRKDILHRCVVYQQAKRQQGTHKAQERNEVSRTGKKFGRQKGGGGARHGDRRAPIFVGGGKAHGPRPRSHAIDLPKKVRRLALRHALSAKQSAGDLMIVDDTAVGGGKTSALSKAFATMGVANALIVDTEVSEAFSLQARNIPHVDVLPVIGANVYDILRRDKLILTKAALAGLEERLK